MINAIEIEMFQRHEHSLLEFDPGFNVIIGSSNAGKSSIVRAIKWATLNRPTSGFKNWYAKPKDAMSVGIAYDDGWLLRERSSKFNGYRGEGDGLPEFELEALRSDLPLEVQRVSQMTDVNIQGQHEKYFLLQDMTASQIGKRISEAVDLGIIDNVRTSSNSYVDRVVNTIRTTENELEEIKPKLEKLKNLDEVEKLISGISFHLERVDKNNKKIRKLSHTIESLEILKKEQEELNEWLEVREPFLLLKKEIDLLSRKKKELGKIKSIVDRVGFLNKHKKNLLGTFPNQALVTKTRKAAVALYRARAKQSKIKKLYIAIQKLQTFKFDAIKRSDALKTRKEELFNSIDICPFCKQVIKHGRKDTCNGGRSHNGTPAQKSKRPVLRNRRS